MREERPLFYDGSGRHPRYHNLPFDGKWFIWLMLIYALFYFVIVFPIVFIERKVLHKEVSWPS